MEGLAGSPARVPRRTPSARSPGKDASSAGACPSTAPRARRPRTPSSRPRRSRSARAPRSRSPGARSARGSDGAGWRASGRAHPSSSRSDSLREAASLVATEDVRARLRGGGLRCVRGDGGVVDVPEGEGARAVVGAVNALVIQRADGAVVRVVASPANGALACSAVVVDEARGATALWGSAGGWCYAREQRLWCQGVHENSPVGGHGVQGATLDALPVAGLRGARSAAVGIRFACAIGEGDDAPRCWGVGPHLFTSEPGHREQLVPPGGAALGSVVDLVTRGQRELRPVGARRPALLGPQRAPRAAGGARRRSRARSRSPARRTARRSRPWRGTAPWGCAPCRAGPSAAWSPRGATTPARSARVAGESARPRRVAGAARRGPLGGGRAARACASLVDGRVGAPRRPSFGATSSDAPPASGTRARARGGGARRRAGTAPVRPLRHAPGAVLGATRPSGTCSRRSPRGARRAAAARADPLGRPRRAPRVRGGRARRGVVLGPGARGSSGGGCSPSGRGRGG